MVTLNEIQYGIRKIEKSDPDFAEILKPWYFNLMTSSELVFIEEITAEIAHISADLRYDFQLPYENSLIAATAYARNLTLVTRNMKDFQRTGIPLRNPWDHQS